MFGLIGSPTPSNPKKRFKVPGPRIVWKNGVALLSLDPKKEGIIILGKALVPERRNFLKRNGISLGEKLRKKRCG